MSQHFLLDTKFCCLGLPQQQATGYLVLSQQQFELKVLGNKLLVAQKMLRSKFLVAEVILNNKILCPSMSSVTISGKLKQNTNTNSPLPDPGLLIHFIKQF